MENVLPVPDFPDTNPFLKHVYSTRAATGWALENSLTRYGAASILGISPLRAWDFRSEQQPGGAPVEMTGDEFVDFA